MPTVPKVTVGAEWVNTFPSGACDQADLSYRDDHAKGFCAQMRERGHTEVFCWGNDNAWESDFRHPDFGGNSLNWVDNVNFLFYSDHGGNWSNTMHIAFSRAADHCIGSSNQWKLGVKNLKWFVLDCCQAVLNTSASHLAAVWFGPAHGVHMIFGFVGNGHDSWWTGGVGGDFGERAGRGDRLGGAWLDSAYSFWLDDNPIAIAFGDTREEAINRRDNETIAWRDYNYSGQPGWMAWRWRS